MKALAAIALALALAGCATVLPIGDYCDTAKSKYMKPATADYLAKHDKEVLQGIVADNEYGEKTCPPDSNFWKPIGQLEIPKR